MPLSRLWSARGHSFRATYGYCHAAIRYAPDRFPALAKTELAAENLSERTPSNAIRIHAPTLGIMTMIL